MPTKDLIRTNGLISGVCSALGNAHYPSSWFFRILFLVSAIVTFIPAIIYLVLWVLLPHEKYVIDGHPRNLLYTKHLPFWFKGVSYLSLFEIIFWPIILFSLPVLMVFLIGAFSSLLGEVPDYFLITLPLTLVAMYPVFFVALMILGFRIYPQNKFVALLFPVVNVIAGSLIAIFGLLIGYGILMS